MSKKIIKKIDEEPEVSAHEEVQEGTKRKAKRKNPAAPTISPDDAPLADLSKFKAAKSASTTRVGSERGILTIVNSKKNGKRIVIPIPVWEYLGKPSSVQVSLSKHRIAIAPTIDGCVTSYPIREHGNKAICYASGLVQEITEKYGLEFDPRTSATFNEIKYARTDACPVVIITIIPLNNKKMLDEKVDS